MKTIFRLIAVALIATSLASCGRTNKSLTATETYSKDVSQTETTESITTTEKVDTLVTLDMETSEATFELHELVDSSRLVIDTPEQSVAVVYDPITQTVRTKAVVKERQVPVTIDRTTTVERAIYERQKSIQKDEQREEQVLKTSPLIPSWLIALIIVLVFAFVAWRTRWLWWP
ncbi:MAG: lipoprotein [Flavobacteriales bacterium]|jgi:ABC-type Na+ efflux pump permease subunit